MKYSLIVLVALLTSCSLFKASSPHTSDFLPYPHRLVEGDVRFPFAATWVAPADELMALQKTHSAIVIQPVVTDFAALKLKERALSEKSEKRSLEDLAEVARYLGASFQNAFSMNPESPLKVESKVSPNTYILELAITELDPTNPVINTLGTAAGAFVPGGGLIKIIGQGGISIEGLLRDGASRKVVMQFKDRETDKAAPITLKDFQEYAHVRESIQDWAIQYSMIMKKPWDPQVADSLPFTLAPF